jgi:hypothetical protein
MVNGEVLVENLNMKVFKFFVAKIENYGWRNKNGNSMLIIGRE